MHSIGAQKEPQVSRGGCSSLSPNQQIGYGCLAIIVIGAIVMYCAGTFSILVRPNLSQRAPTPTIITRPVFDPTSTKPPPTFINLPAGTLPATPTQAPIPTRELSTLTPTLDLTSTVTITGTLSPSGSTPRSTFTATRTPTRRTNGTVTSTPRP